MASGWSLLILGGLWGGGKKVCGEGGVVRAPLPPPFGWKGGSRDRTDVKVKFFIEIVRQVRSALLLSNTGGGGGILCGGKYESANCGATKPVPLLKMSKLCMATSNCPRETVGACCYFPVELVFHSQYSANATSFSALLHNGYVLWQFD